MLRMVCQPLKLLFKVHKSQFCFNVKLNMHFYMYSFLVLFITFPIIKLRNYMVAGPHQPQTLNYDLCQKMTYMYIMYYIELLPV